MKLNVRQGIFETNSSSEHSITIMKTDLYDRWVKGEIAVRFYTTDESESPETWGNFWSEQMFFDYCELCDADKKNRELVNEIINEEKGYIVDLLHTFDTMSDERVKELEHDYHRPISELRQQQIDGNEKTVKMWEAYPDGVCNTTKLYHHLYITHKEYYDALRHGDCASVFIHRNSDNTIFGTYYHS